MLGDQLYFYAGRAKGQSALEKRQNWKSKVEEILLLLDKHQILLMLGFRFLYGLRTITPFVLGISRIAPFRFLIFNIIGALSWAIAIGAMGYLFGHTLEVIIGDIKRYEFWFFIGLAAIGIVIWTVRFMRKK